ncbi:pyrazinamidase/nicotinamidase [Williamsoniiplasma somnilux]|uniref:nicotinamidase n=1 Tax=Williamsoniiplasma somnilux TaxID=215578 RepID=A0A2K8NXA0_9MOLU|nr:isochorismatase family protein [Williamsoniiplasma somnilux]ATZ18450.1 pyrazinamidase/nicotinamidase [Williamsoniiplasma somnilux]
MKEVLLIVDYQYDFANPKGTLYVQGADQIGSYIEQLIKKFQKENKLIVGSKDWHPIDHYSFAQWGPHCIQNSLGAELLYDAKILDKLIIKGENQNLESYSAFYDEQDNSNGLHEWLQKQNIEQIYLVGVATDVCVGNTLNDALKLGYKVKLDLNGCAGITNVIKFK